MRILFCSQAAHTGGGVEAWLEALSEALASCGWEVVTGLAKGRFHDPARYAVRHRVSQPVEIDGTRGLRELRILELLRVFERVRPDVILPVNLADAMTAAALWKSRGANARLAVCVHGQTADRIEQVRAVAPFVDLATSVSRRVTEQLRDVMHDDARVRHLPMGVPPPIATPQPRTRIRDVAYVGRLDRGDKRVGDAVEMVRALRASGVVFHFAGTGPDEAWLREQLRDERVVFHGPLDRATLYAKIYPSVDALTIFSESETGPIVAWEAMVHGIVPVVSDYIGRREENVIRDGETGIVFPVGDPAAGARRMLDLEGGGTPPAQPPGRQRSGAPASTPAEQGASRSLASKLSSAAMHALPAAYTLEGFRAGWCDALQSCMDLPIRRGTELPALPSPGLLSRLGLGLEGTARLRRLLGRSFTHDEPGSEWPH